MKESLERDISTIKSRVSSEGLAFLTKTLPKLGKAFDQGLVSSRFKIPLGFKRSRRNQCIPAFMQGSINLVFDEDGLLRDVVPANVIRYVRQVLYFAYKLEISYSKSDEAVVIDNFVRTDAELSLQCDPLASDLIHLAKIITGKVFHGFDHKDIRPRHGPGAVATGEKLEDKWTFARLYNRIHQVYPYYDYYVVGGARELSDRLDWYNNLQRLESGVAKVVLVPKDSRGPRLISCEPLEYQWIQQGLGRKLSSFLEWTSVYTKHRVNFTRQEINRDIAKTSSASQRYATLDLKDASDRVSLELVRRVFADSPSLLRALEACRTTETRLPNGSLITLNKFAPMGSALCFPVEAFVFWVVIVSAIIRRTKMPLERAGRLVYVYGDDIVVPTRYAQLSIQALEVVGLLVNLDKSCTTGYFRESCGMDAFKGTDVTPSRLSTPWSNRSTDGSALASYTSLANALFAKGFVEASQFLWKELARVYGKIPFGTVRSSYPHRLVASPLQADVLNRTLFRWRTNRNYQRTEFLLPSLSSRRIKSGLSGWPRLLRDMVSYLHGDPSVVVVPRSTLIKRRWTTVG